MSKLEGETGHSAHFVWCPNFCREADEPRRANWSAPAKKFTKVSREFVENNNEHRNYINFDHCRMDPAREFGDEIKDFGVRAIGFGARNAQSEAG
jgi:hypothetical protein